ncbi:hypothetical protein KC19_1G313300 [Ceratodon purpureus]|uniref:Uncharacterized protein n=1 Tax=Ceratodon purpureus TaxID=3225 RepID=A0A8T0JCN4_CERPU|nr:hypothetical protein KC19_1G313300 [Ceratodon purpureus]
MYSRIALPISDPHPVIPSLRALAPIVGDAKPQGEPSLICKVKGRITVQELKIFTRMSLRQFRKTPTKSSADPSSTH